MADLTQQKIITEELVLAGTDLATTLGNKQEILTETNFGSFSSALTAKTAAVDADTINLIDSADSGKSKKFTWANVKASLKTYFDTLYVINSWQPPQIPIFAQSSPAFGPNTGAGLYASLSGGSADDVLTFNIPLRDGRGNAYDGSTIFLRMHVKLSALSLIADTVGLILSYTFVEVGDNSTTDVTTVAQQNTTFSLVPAGIESNIGLANISGPAGSHTLQVNIMRNSTGASADSYLGNLRVTNVELIKV